MSRSEVVQQQPQQGMCGIQEQILKRSEAFKRQLAIDREANDRWYAEMKEFINGISVRAGNASNHGGNMSSFPQIDFPVCKVRAVTMQHSFGMENHFSVDAPQLFEKSPKGSMRIRLDVGASSFVDPLADLMKLKQLETVEQYRKSFEALLTGVDLPVGEAVSCFLSGLRDEIQSVVRTFKPRTLYDAICLAKLQEATLALIARGARSSADNHSSHVSDIGSQSKTVPPVGLGPQRASSMAHSFTGCNLDSRTNLSTFQPAPGRGTLGPEEVMEDKARNACLFYDEKRSPGEKGAQVCSLGILEEHRDNEQEHEVVEEEAKGGWNPPNRLFDVFEKSIPSVCVKVSSAARQEQQENWGWKEANGSCVFVFDPGDIAKGSLAPEVETIHPQEAAIVGMLERDDDLKVQIGNTLRRDAFLVFRALCKLSMEMPPKEVLADPQLMRGRLVALELLKTAQGVPPGVTTTLLSLQEVTLKFDVMKSLVAILESMGDWMNQQLLIPDPHSTKKCEPVENSVEVGVSGLANGNTDEPAEASDVPSEAVNDVSDVQTIEQHRAYKLEFQEVVFDPGKLGAGRHQMVVGKSKMLLEFGIKRAQGLGGGVSAAKYCYLGAVVPRSWEGCYYEATVYHHNTLKIEKSTTANPTVQPYLRGGYPAFTVQDSAGVLHMKKLSAAGLAHVHSWGYNSILWETPKVGYASNLNGPCRITEFRKRVQALNDNRAKVISMLQGLSKSKDGVRQGIPQARSWACICTWQAEISAVFKPAAVRLIFDPRAVVLMGTRVVARAAVVHQSPPLARQPWVVFDPGGMIFLLTRLLLHTIHNLEAKGAVFDPGKHGKRKVVGSVVLCESSGCASQRRGHLEVSSHLTATFFIVTSKLEDKLL